MKKTLGSYYCRYFSMPYLFREDLEAIERVIQDQLKPEKFHIAFNGCEYDNVADLEDLTTPAHVMVLYTKAPSLRLKLARSWSEIYAGDMTPGMDEVMRAISAIIGKTERKTLWAITKYSSWMAPLIGFGTVAISTNLIILHILPIQFQYVNAAFLAVSSIWWMIGYRFRVFQFSRIDLRKRPNA